MGSSQIRKTLINGSLAWLIAVGVSLPGESAAVSLVDGNSSIDYEVVATGAKNGTGFLGLVSTLTEFDGSTIVVPTLTQSEWYVRIGTSGAALSLADHDITAGPTAVGSNVVTASFADPMGRYTIDFTGSLLGSPSPSPLLAGLSENLFITSQETDLVIDLFHYADFDFFEPTRETIEIQDVSMTNSLFVQSEQFDFAPCDPADESCRPFSPDSFYLLLLSGSGLASGDRVIGAQAGEFSVLRDLLQSPMLTDLMLDGTTMGDDLTFATQFRLSLMGPPGSTFDFTQTRLPVQNILVPEPGVALLLATALAGAGLRRRRLS